MSQLSQIRNIAAGATAAQQAASYTGISGKAPTPVAAAVTIANIYGHTKAPSWAIDSIARYESERGSVSLRRATHAVMSAAAKAATQARFTAASLSIGANLGAGLQAAVAQKLVVDPVLTWFDPDEPSQIPVIDPIINIVNTISGPPREPSIADSYYPAYDSLRQQVLSLNPDAVFVERLESPVTYFDFLQLGDEQEMAAAVAYMADRLQRTQDRLALEATLRAREEQPSSSGESFASTPITDIDLESYGIPSSSIKRDPSSGQVYAIRGSRGLVLVHPGMTVSTFNQIWNEYQ